MGTKSRSDAVVGEKKKDEFYKKIAALDQKLREGWRTYSTKKTRAVTLSFFNLFIKNLGKKRTIPKCYNFMQMHKSQSWISKSFVKLL